jgi:hypothetical protein
VLQALQSPEATQAVWQRVQALDARIAEPTVVLAIRNLSEVWKQLFAEEQQRIVRLLIERVNVMGDATEIAKREGVHRATVNELLRLALLAPSIIEAALAGRLGVQLEVAVATNRCSNVAMGRLPKLSIPTPLRRLTKTSLIHWQVPSVLLTRQSNRF